MILQNFMHRMHSVKNLRCLVGILENEKCILQILISRAEVRIWILILVSIFNFC
jgi:hypothetical protein